MYPKRIACGSRDLPRLCLSGCLWATAAASCACFPPQFHAVAVSNRPQLLTILPKLSPSQHVAALTKQLLHCMACYQLLQFKGSMLALAIVSLELEKLLPDWLALIIELLQKAQVRGCWHHMSQWGGTRGCAWLRTPGIQPVGLSDPSLTISACFCEDSCASA